MISKNLITEIIIKSNYTIILILIIRVFIFFKTISKYHGNREY